MTELIAAVVLAAGESSRMGSPKSLLTWAGVPLLTHQLDQLAAAMITQVIRAGVAATTPGASAVLVTAVDQPLSASTVTALVTGLRRSGTSIAVPCWQNRRGHPPLFDRSLIPDLLQVREETQGLRELMHRCRGHTCLVDVANPLIHLNLNRPEDYLARQQLGGLSIVAG